MRAAIADPAPRRAFSIPDLFWILFILALLVVILLPSMSRGRQRAKRAVCAANQRGIGVALHIYSNDNEDWMPHHYYEPTYDATKVPPEHGVRWVGTMGSNDFLKVTEDSKQSPKRSHPSRSLFMLVINGTSSPKQFICPSAGDREDPLTNYRGAEQIAAQPMVNRFDFRGYDTLSYGYQLPYGQKGKPREGLDPRMVIVADKGPYYADGGEGLAGSMTRRDKLSGMQPPKEWLASGDSAILQRPESEWRSYNSRNHTGEGQNVTHVDGHVSFQGRPLAGVNFDNIYTLNSGYEKLASLIGMVPEAEQAVGPLTNTDSFIVP